MQTRPQYNDVEKQLLRAQETDRANAPRNQAVFDLVRRLKDIHKGYLSGLDPLWTKWASNILSSEAHLQEGMIQELPPDPLLRRFGHGTENPVQQVITLRRSVAIGQRVNKGSEEVREKLADDVNMLIESLESSMKFAKVLKARIDGFEIQTNSNANLMEGFEEASGAAMNEISLQHFNSITQQQDVDH